MKIRKGLISIGERVNAQTYTKYVLQNGKLVSSQFTVEGRKHPREYHVSGLGEN